MARGRWLKKMATRAQERLDDVKDFVESVKVEDKTATSTSTGSSSGMTNFLSGGMDLSKMNLGPTVQNIKERGLQCCQVATETVELCESTKAKSQQMVDFGSEIQGTLKSLGESSLDASSLETIRDLTDGAKLKEAMEIAKGMDEVALGCIDKSIQMIDIMEDAMDDLPDAMEKWIEKLAHQQDSRDDDNALLSMKNLDEDIDQVKKCIEEMQQLNIATAFQLGLQAFQQLTSRAKQSQEMFDSIRGFSSSVRDITEDFGNLDVMGLSSNIKDILKCIRLSEVMRTLAEGAKKIIQVLIDLFKATSDRISTLWAALAFAKDCMRDCLEYITDAKVLVVDAHDKSRSLLQKTESVWDQLQSIKSVNRQSFQAVRALSQGDEIPTAIELANGMDELIMECTGKVTSMVDRVSEGFHNLPPIITDGINLETEGQDGNDPQPTGVEEDIAELEASKLAIEESNVVSACKSGAAGFASVSKKTEVCSEMLVNVRDFATNCDGTIASFMVVWDLESALTKIQEMCRLVSLGELMKQFASQIKQLVLAIVALMKTTLAKLSSFDMADFGENLDGMVGDAVGSVMGDQVGDAVEQKVDEAMNKITGKFNKFFKG